MRPTPGNLPRSHHERISRKATTIGSHAIETVLFDLDGTITNPMEGITRSIQYALERLDSSKNRSQEELSVYIGPPLRGVFAELLSTDDAAVAEEAVRLYRERYGSIGLMECYLFPGIAEALEALNGAGVRLFLATSKPHVYAQEILNRLGIGPLFDHMHGSELDGTRDDKSELIQYILETERIQPSSCAMVGDRKFDLIGARNNGLRPVGVSYGFGSRQELEEAGAEVICHSASEVSSWVISQRRGMDAANEDEA